jgi:hypothetical protein
LIGIRPKSVSELWALQTAEEREAYVKNFIETDFYDWLNTQIGLDIKQEMAQFKIDPRFALLILTVGEITDVAELALYPVAPELKKRMIVKRLRKLFSHSLNTNVN